MPRATEDDHKDEDAPVGPTDQGRTGGMATRENDSEHTTEDTEQRD
jgi:hypothetical protein